MTRSLSRTALGLALLLSATFAWAQVKATGEFTTAFSSFLGNPALIGEYQIVEQDGKKYLEFGANFKAQRAPDLKVFLSTQKPDAVRGSNATKDAVRLGLLKDFTGHQRYEIPSGVDLETHSTVIVHCEKYSKLWGTGSLE